MKKIYLLQKRTSLCVYQFNLSFYQKGVNYFSMLNDLIGSKTQEFLLDEHRLNYTHYKLLIYLLSTFSRFNKRNSSYQQLRIDIEEYFSPEQLTLMLTSIENTFKFLTSCPMVFHYLAKPQVTKYIEDDDLPF